MILLYYCVLAFGVLLLLFTASAWFKTTKKVNARETNFSEKLNKTVKKLQKTGNLWFYYFTAGDKIIWSEISLFTS
ncbi:Flp pilus assembly protein [Actinobacillus equuli]|nr:Flp pilus assembly protein [Actinobacillus equuli]